jgi:hypothetical protein
MLDTGVSMMVLCLLHHNVMWTGTQTPNYCTVCCAHVLFQLDWTLLDYSLFIVCHHTLHFLTKFYLVTSVINFVRCLYGCPLFHETGDVSDVLHQRYYRSCSTPFSLYLLAVANQHKILMLMEFGLTCLVIEQVI